MNFFEHQDHAHRLTHRLIALFIVALVCIVIAVNGTLALVWLIAYPRHDAAGMLTRLPKHFFFTNTAITLLFIVGGTLLELWRLRDGGDAVAKSAGGRLLSAGSNTLSERRILNIVEEMALASGVAVPRVYVLERESGINAFAAGYGPNEAVIAVTHGALTRLSRDELQGVIGHEFSHILNGDMRLNLRLMGVLYGILLISMFGSRLMSLMQYGGGSRRSNNDGTAVVLALFVAGLCLWIVGSIGVFFGRLIKSAVSRQREFLADASAIQFTRNADGIGSALRKIGGLSKAGEANLKIGSEIHSTQAESLSHMFLGAARPSFMSGWLATHPPLEERIRRIYGRNMGVLHAPEAAIEYPQAEPILAPLPYEAAAFAAANTMTSDDVLLPVRPVISEALRSAVRIPITAQHLAFGLLLAHDTQERDQQLAAAERVMPSLRKDDLQIWAPSLQALAPELRLALIDLATPALKQLDASERQQFLKTVDALIRADGRITLSEFVLQTIFERRLDAQSGRAVPIRYYKLDAVRPAIEIVLSLVANVAAHQSHDELVNERAFNQGLQALEMTGLHLQPQAALRFETIRDALDQLNQLAPLKKPALIKALLLAAQSTGTALLSLTSIDLLCAISTALDVPTPPQLR